MSATVTSIRVKEWETGGTLTGVFLPEDARITQTVKELSRAGMLHIEELRHGTRVRASSWVGRITLGDLQVTVEPKITGMPLLRLVRYAYGLRNLSLIGVSSYDLSAYTFLDLLIHQLAAEAEELIRRGLRREYVRRDAYLTIPQGRLDLHRYIRGGATPTATLPCTFHPCSEDTVINQALLAGLRLARHISADPALRALLANHCRLLEEEITSVHLDTRMLQRARRRMSRLTVAYEPALTLIELLMGAQGVNLEGEAEAINVPGFLFDMNRFFQTLLSRFLSENLQGCQVRDEHRLLGMMAYDPRYNPRRRPVSAPRPDFVVLKANKTVAVLDAKYRDLWENPLPRNMLYQLVIYALSQQERRIATILYPTLDSNAADAHIVINDTVEGRRTGRVILRPVNMNALAERVAEASSAHERSLFADMLAFGKEIRAA